MWSQGLFTQEAHTNPPQPPGETKAKLLLEEQDAKDDLRKVSEVEGVVHLWDQRNASPDRAPFLDLNSGVVDVPPS